MDDLDEHRTRSARAALFFSQSGRSETQSAWGHTVTFITRLIRPNKIEFTQRHITHTPKLPLPHETPEVNHAESRIEQASVRGMIVA